MWEAKQRLSFSSHSSVKSIISDLVVFTWKPSTRPFVHSAYHLLFTSPWKCIFICLNASSCNLSPCLLHTHTHSAQSISLLLKMCAFLCLFFLSPILSISFLFLALQLCVTLLIWERLWLIKKVWLGKKSDSLDNWKKSLAWAEYILSSPDLSSSSVFLKVGHLLWKVQDKISRTRSTKNHGEIRQVNVGRCRAPASRHTLSPWVIFWETSFLCSVPCRFQGSGAWAIEANKQGLMVDGDGSVSFMCNNSWRIEWLAMPRRSQSSHLPQITSFACLAQKKAMLISSFVDN